MTKNLPSFSASKPEMDKLQDKSWKKNSLIIDILASFLRIYSGVLYVGGSNQLVYARSPVLLLLMAFGVVLPNAQTFVDNPFKRQSDAKHL